MLRTHCLQAFLFLFILSACDCGISYSQEKTSIARIVIDAGHGGKDPGTIGKKVKEKQVVLSVALKLGKLLNEKMPGVTVTYTRKNDEFVELFERAEIANRQHADLFLSIHCNANPSHAFQGAETYIMGLHRSEANLMIAKQENASILMEPDYAVNYQGFDPNSDESYITFTLFQNAYLEQSTRLASYIQDELKDRVGLNDRGVRQAGFLVLYKTTMPSVLVETGFLSNPSEENFLISEKGQDFIASAICRAVIRFAGNLANHTAVENKDSGSIVKEDTRKEVPPKPVPEKPATVKKPPQISFRIQVATSPSDIGVKSKRFSGLEDVRVYKHQGLYKYTTGSEQTLDEALRLLESVKKKGFKDAFVVAFEGDQRITIERAKQILGTSGQN